MHENLKLDIFPHIFPRSFFERVKARAESNPGLAAALKRWLDIPVLWDLDARLRMMRRFTGYKQVLTLSRLRASPMTGWPRLSLHTRNSFQPSSRLCP